MPDASSPALYNAIADWYARWIERESWVHPTIESRLPELTGLIAGQTVLDLACGEGHWSRILARSGAIVTGIDLSQALLEIAEARRDDAGHSLSYLLDDARTLSRLEDASFVGALCVLALMDIPDLVAVFGAVHRVVRPGGWFGIAVTHPCFDGPQASWLDGDNGNLERLAQTYLTEGHWISTYPHGVRGQVGAWHRTISTYVTTAIRSGWAIEHMIEPVTLTHEGTEVAKGAEIPRVLMIRFRHA